MGPGTASSAEQFPCALTTLSDCDQSLCSCRVANGLPNIRAYTQWRAQDAKHFAKWPALLEARTLQQKLVADCAARRRRSSGIALKIPFASVRDPPGRYAATPQHITSHYASPCQVWKSANRTGRDECRMMDFICIAACFAASCVGHQSVFIRCDTGCCQPLLSKFCFK